MMQWKENGLLNMRASMTWFWCSVTQTNAVKSVGGRSKFVCFGVSARFLHGFKLCRGYDHWKDTAWRDSKNCREHFLTGWIFAHTLVIIYKCVDTFLLKRPKLTRFWTFFKKAVTNAVWATLTKQKLLGECTKWRLFINQNDERRNHFHAIKGIEQWMDEWSHMFDGGKFR